MDLHVDIGARGDRAARIYRELLEAILDGRLRAGRAAAADPGARPRLGVSRSTVAVGLRPARRRGLPRVARSARGRSSLRRDRRAEAATEPRAVAGRGAAAPSGRCGRARRRAPPDRALRRTTSRVGMPDTGCSHCRPGAGWCRANCGRRRSTPAAYGDPAGHPALRAAIARYVGTVAVACARPPTTSRHPGRPAGARPRRPGAGRAGRLRGRRGARLPAAPGGSSGRSARAWSACRSTTRASTSTRCRARPASSTPRRHTSSRSASPMSLERRTALLDWAERHGAVIIEDDYDSEFRFEDRPLAPLQSLDRGGRVVYVGSFSKTLLPILRLGFLVAPASLQPALRDGQAADRLARRAAHPGRPGPVHRRGAARPAHPQGVPRIRRPPPADRGDAARRTLPDVFIGTVRRRSPPGHPADGVRAASTWTPWSPAPGGGRRGAAGWRSTAASGRRPAWCSATGSSRSSASRRPSPPAGCVRADRMTCQFPRQPGGNRPPSRAAPERRLASHVRGRTKHYVGGHNDQHRCGTWSPKLVRLRAAAVRRARRRDRPADRHLDDAAPRQRRLCRQRRAGVRRPPGHRGQPDGLGAEDDEHELPRDEWSRQRVTTTSPYGDPHFEGRRFVVPVEMPRGHSCRGKDLDEGNAVMTQYLLSVMQPVGPTAAEPEVLAEVAKQLDALNRDLQDGRLLGLRRRPAPSPSTATVVRVEGRRDAHHRRPVRRGQGVPRRLHDRRRRRPGRRPRRRAAGWPRSPRCRSRCARSGADRGRDGHRAASSARSTAGRSPSWSASSATSTSPRRRCRRRSPRPSSAGRPTGVPPSPAGWIITTARNRAIDRLRREAAREDRQAQAALLHAADVAAVEEGPVRDDRLRLIFTCCHPALAPAAQVALTLRLLGGLTTRGDRARVPRARADDGPAHRPRQGQDPRRPHPVPGAARGRPARPAARRARRGLPDLQRGVRGQLRRRAGPRRPVRRGDPAGPAARRADARRARGARAARAHAAHRRPPAGPRRRRRRPGAARRAGPHAAGTRR